ncbi:MAG: hypothetical protein IH937_05720 [Acidobacteria bacterium]|nr:hypothetical protein [Acidobacteriota bacterium]
MNHKPNIKFPQTSIVERGRPEEGAFVPLVNALTRPKVDARHQAVSVQTTLGIYEETRDTQRGQKYRKYGGKLLANVTGFHYLKAEVGVEYFFLEKKEVQKIVKELKAKNNFTWPLRLVFAKSKKDLPGNLSELEKPETPVLLEEIPSGLLDFSNPSKFERCYFAQVRLFYEGLSDDEAIRKIFPQLVKERDKFSKKREKAKERVENAAHPDAAKLWKEKFSDAGFFLRKVDHILELAEVHLGVDLAEARVETIVDGVAVPLIEHWKERDKVTHAQAAVILNLKQTRSIREKVKDDDLRSAGTGYISVPSLLEYLNQKSSPQN